MKPVFSLPLLLAALVCAVPARAQLETREGIFLQNQIQELKRDIALLRDQVARGGGGSSLGAAPRQGPVASGDVTAALLERYGEWAGLASLHLLRASPPVVRQERAPQARTASA